ncbi:ATP-binding cassette domain-containing protein [Spiroplasma endosymbiont of Nebria brevicollis]|uniref:ATP-binding cassette domain-containing protein n=1 Tax=Spiroplasma endosymbiont of Nebria brevicollis TaxID=3066284 RepID=UPI00313EFFDA
MNDEHSYEIELNNVTKTYSETVGVFDINIKIKQGEIYGFIGPNGAGKSTTIRQMVGFIKPDYGTITINNKNAWTNSKEIMKVLGYIPGENILPDYMKAIDYLKAIAGIRYNVEWTYVEKLINYRTSPHMYLWRKKWIEMNSTEYFKLKNNVLHI